MSNVKTVIVLGTARSGTSLTCGVFDALGVKMLSSKPKRSQLRHNPKGMFEIPNLMNYGQRLISPTDPTALSLEIKDSIKKLSPEEGMWGIKAPCSFNLHLITRHMPNCHLMCVFRNIIDQAKSFQMFRLKIDKILTPLDELIDEMAKNNRDISLESIRLNKDHKIPVSYTTYESLKANPLEEVDRFSKFLGITPTDEQKDNVLKFVDPSLHTWKEDGSNVVPIELEIEEELLEVGETLTSPFLE